ncbi:DciA family protein [Saccharibacter sp. 17.LH.SD]|uniref:DciA family protein n=1 Tax=Saccharibacter sp. 17.LH.SD TaxID=2689393 RepID=UPI00351B2686
MSHSPVKIPKEVVESSRSGARMIGALIPALTRQAFRRKSPLFVRLVMDWEHIVGPHLAQQSEPCRLRPGVLTIRCSGPVAMEIQYGMPRIIEQINMACGLRGDAVIQQLKIIQDRTIMTSLPKRRKLSSRPFIVSDMEEGPLREALERLGGHIAAQSRHRKN